MHQRGGRGSGEREKCSVAVLLFPCDGPRSAWLFKCLMPLADVKGAAVTQEERDRMAGGRAGVFFFFSGVRFDIWAHVIQHREGELTVALVQKSFGLCLVLCLQVMKDEIKPLLVAP